MREKGPLSRPFDLGAVSRLDQPVRIDATAEERHAIADQFDLLSLDSLAAEFEIAQRLGERFELRGRLKGSLVQRCVVSLAPVRQELDEEIVLDLVPAGSPAAEADASADRDPPEVYEGNSVDLGAIALQYFALGLDPYPRAPGAELPPEAKADEPSGPFAALGSLPSVGSKRSAS